MDQVKLRTWTPLSWRTLPKRQMPEYPDEKLFEESFRELQSYPPLVTSWEIEALKKKLKQAGRGEAFLLQGGDCAETFDNCNSVHIVKLLKVMLQMSFILIHELNVPIIRVGRMAGQYAKPRSNDSEMVGDEEIPIYRGDLFNAIEPDNTLRQPDPRRLNEAYQKSAMTLNFMRALTEGGGFADLHHPEYWELDFMLKNKYYKEYESMVRSILNAINFMEKLLPTELVTLKQVDMYTSHEALNLYYESAQTRQVPHTPGWYNLTTHLPWIGNRTRNLEEAHIEYFRGIRNPVGIKVGGKVDVFEIIKVIERLNPGNEEGKIVLITRYGRDKVTDQLPDLIRAVQDHGLHVVWSCDPMHGNTFTSSTNYKTRDFEDILEEIKQTFMIHREMRTVLGGVHLELTGDNVTECVGGAKGLNENGLSRNYKSYCDPRLNYEQSLEMAFLIAKEWKYRNGHS